MRGRHFHRNDSESGKYTVEIDRIVADGPFALAFANLQATGFELRWQSRADDRERQKKAASKTKYTCLQCNQNAWGKPGAMFLCGLCYAEDGKISAMEEAKT